MPIIGMSHIRGKKKQQKTKRKKKNSIVSSKWHNHALALSPGFPSFFSVTQKHGKQMDPGYEANHDEADYPFHIKKTKLKHCFPNSVHV